MEGEHYLSEAQEQRLGAFFSTHEESTFKMKKETPKKKPKRNKRKKTNAKGATAFDESSTITSPVPFCPPSKKKLRRLRYQQRVSSAFEFLRSCAESLEFTGSVQVSDSAKTTCSSLQVVTSCAPYSQISVYKSQPLARIYVRPLLVLDLNGILCHRFRPPSPYARSAYRTEVACIASTPIIARPDHDFLQFLDAHFCLAVWTSAKSRNAISLAKVLIPSTVNLLFLWAQHDCDIVKGENGVALHEKNLAKVWKQYPLYNAHNTLLMDDSPEKCRKWHKNAIHPPSMHGLRQDFVREHNERLRWSNQNAELLLSDEENGARQRVFFEALAERWRYNYVVTDWAHDTDSGKTQSPPILQNYLKQHAIGHMGWV
jgi:hypothetical protein